MLRLLYKSVFSSCPALRLISFQELDQYRYGHSKWPGNTLSSMNQSAVKILASFARASKLRFIRTTSYILLARGTRVRCGGTEVSSFRTPKK